MCVLIIFDYTTYIDVWTLNKTRGCLHFVNGAIFWPDCTVYKVMITRPNINGVFPICRMKSYFILLQSRLGGKPEKSVAHRGGQR